MGAPYQSQTVSGYNSSPPPDDGTTVPANKITWNSTIKGKIGDPLNTFIAAVNSQLVTWSDFSSATTSTSLTTTTAHHMQTIEVTSGSPTISLGDAATMTKNYVVTVTNTGTGAPVIALATAANTLDGTSNGTFTYPTGTKTSFTFKVNNGATGYYTEISGGRFPGGIDSGSTSALALKTNNGTVGLQILDTAGGNRNITVASSNSGNPTISTTGGSLAITPSVVIASGSLLSFPGAIPASGSGTINFGYDTAKILFRNQLNNADFGLVQAATINSVTNRVLVGNSSSGVIGQGGSGSGAPTTSDISSGQWILWRDTTGATTKLYYNNAGSIQSVALA